MFTLEGRTAIISGATGHDGSGVVRALVEGGMNVVLVTHNPANAQKLIESLGENSHKCIAITDAIKDGGFEQAYKSIKEHFGSVDVIIPNQGGPIGREELDEITEEAFLKKLNHQIVKSFVMVQKSLPYLYESKAPRIIFMASAGARNGLEDEFLSDSVARGGVISMTYSLARELAPKGITVNCIAKSGLENPKPPETHADYDPTKLAKKIPLGRNGNPDEFGAAVAYLASEESGFVTGQVINLCGGLCMG